MIKACDLFRHLLQTHFFDSLQVKDDPEVNLTPRTAFNSATLVITLDGTQQAVNAFALYKLDYTVDSMFQKLSKTLKKAYNNVLKSRT